MKRIILIAIALTVICSENGYARDKDGIHRAHDSPTCREFLEQYATVKFKGSDNIWASYNFHQYDS